MGSMGMGGGMGGGMMWFPFMKAKPIFDYF